MRKQALFVCLILAVGFVFSPQMPGKAKNLTLILPRGGEKLTVGSVYNIKWRSTARLGNLRIYLLKGPAVLGTLAGEVPLWKRSFKWKVGTPLISGKTRSYGPGRDYRIKIVDSRGQADQNQRTFTILPARLKMVQPKTFKPHIIEPGKLILCFVKVVSPNGGEQLKIGQNHSIQWTHKGIKDPVQISLYKGNTFLGDIAQNVPVGDNKYLWAVGCPLISGAVRTYLPGKDYKIKISCNRNIQDLSDGYFTILGPDPVKPPDIALVGIKLDPASPVTNESIYFICTVKNAGQVDLPAISSLMMSWNVRKAGESWPNIGRSYYGSMSALKPGETTDVRTTQSFLKPSDPGDYQLQIKNLGMGGSLSALETNKENNKGMLDFTVYPNQKKPDYTVKSISVVPATPAKDSQFEVKAVVINQGDVHPSRGFGNRLRILQGSTVVFERYVSISGGGLNSDFNANWVVPGQPAGDYTVEVKTDSGDIHEEKDETNNVLAIKLTIPQTGGETAGIPDIELVAIKLNPASPLTNEKLYFICTVKNAGEMDLPAISSLMMSWNVRKAGESWPNIGRSYYGFMSALKPGETTDVTTTQSFLTPPDPGDYQLQIKNLGMGGSLSALETNKENNKGMLDFTVSLNPQKPDYTVKSISVVPSQPARDSQFEVKAVVINQGDVHPSRGFGNRLRILQGSAVVFERYVSISGGGLNSDFNANWVVPGLPAGDYIVEVTTDSSNSHVEKDEGNNQKTIPLTVY